MNNKRSDFLCWKPDLIYAESYAAENAREMSTSLDRYLALEADLNESWDKINAAAVARGVRR